MTLAKVDGLSQKIAFIAVGFGALAFTTHLCWRRHTKNGN